MTIKKDGYYVSQMNLVYWNASVIKGADASSFQIFNDTWAKDRKCVYCNGQKVTKAGVNSFQALNSLYAKDNNHCYYPGGIIKEADVASFRVLDDGVCLFESRNGFGDHVHTRRGSQGYAADAGKVFFHIQTIGKPCVAAKADPETFQVLGCGHGRDEQNVYYEGRGSRRPMSIPSR